jgi:ribosomal protein L17
MPPRGYRHLSIREEVYRKLEEFAKSKGLAYPADAIPLLLEYADIYSKLEYLLQVRVKDLLQTGVITSTASKATTSSGNTPPPTTVAEKEQPKERRRVIVFTLEWARQKGINIEEYIARKEREGYICNDTGREVVCVWREDVEQIVVELNSAGVKMGEFEKVLSGEKLNTARIAEKAGLLWYDNREKRWRAPL